MKKVLLIVIDALDGPTVESAMAQGRLPMLSQIRQAGEARFDSDSVFPSITPTATASIATGRYPSQHNIAGNFWYEEATRTVVYYGSDSLAVLHRSLVDFFEDFLVLFNVERLSAKTIFERMALLTVTSNLQEKLAA